MARINTNVASLTAQRGLAKSQRTLNDTLQRLSSGLRINRGADDPAGLIASEGLRSEMSGISHAIDNSQRASNVISTAEGSLNEISSLLLDTRALINHAANTGANPANDTRLASSNTAVARDHASGNFTSSAFWYGTDQGFDTPDLPDPEGTFH